MDFGIGFLSNNVMLPILDFFYGIVPSYGLAIVALTLVIRFAVYPLSAGSIRNMRRMKVVQPLMQERMKEIQERYKDNPTEQQKAMSEVYKEFGNPLAGCFPLLLQLPILFALFATLRGSPFANVNYQVNLQIVPSEQVTEVQPFSSKPQNIYVAEGIHYPVQAVLPSGTKLGVGQDVNLDFQTKEGKPFTELLKSYPETQIQPSWQITRGQERVTLDETGHLVAMQPGDVTIQGTIPGMAAEKGFLFISALGRVGAVDNELVTTLPGGGRQINWGGIHWDILAMILTFGVSLYVNQLLSGQGAAANSQQKTMNQLTPIIFSGMFLFFPLPAGVLLYMLIANIFQTVQTFILQREPLPENLQKLLDEKEKAEAVKNRSSLPFESKTKRKPSS
ncbi:membrane protein insertase YidC [Candidatus Synechococcus calcipolaris G9]|uniref:Membrane protein insertase YidC n=1 Tax=Candidatus Synechococcus calcipolaris G9 TaxID=1497997 RepID=A0ABT6EWA9_9SYNE|nr:membrane protein insertase YidC [Candidatus Synechococcus calcipolaris]MDG2990069.1 membrane protein insertase YidC [Candidatus Synechococcus calcipolaris G9]